MCILPSHIQTYEDTPPLTHWETYAHTTLPPQYTHINTYIEHTPHTPIHTHITYTYYTCNTDTHHTPHVFHHIRILHIQQTHNTHIYTTCTPSHTHITHTYYTHTTDTHHTPHVLHHICTLHIHTTQIPQTHIHTHLYFITYTLHIHTVHIHHRPWTMIRTWMTNMSLHATTRNKLYFTPRSKATLEYLSINVDVWQRKQKLNFNKFRLNLEFFRKKRNSCGVYKTKNST